MGTQAKANIENYRVILEYQDAKAQLVGRKIRRRDH